MASLNKLFRSRSPKFEKESLFDLRLTGREFGKSVSSKAEPSDYTISSKDGVYHVSPKSMQRLRLLGCSDEYIGDLLRTVNILTNFSNRPVDPPTLEEIKRRYRLGMGTMASIASISNLRLSDLGIDLRGLARFYSRNRGSIRDVEELERFVNWVQSRGESVNGAPSAWRRYSMLNRTSRARSCISSRRRSRPPKSTRRKRRS